MALGAFILKAEHITLVEKKDLSKHAPGRHSQQSHAGGRSKIYQDLGEWQESVEPSTDEQEEKLLNERNLLSASQTGIEGEVFLKNYVGSNGIELNKKLRAGSADDEDLMDADALDEIIDAAPVAQSNFTVYRGVTLQGGAKETFEKLEQGDIFQDPGFISTTLDPMIALQMGGQQGLIFKIEVPPQSKGVFINSVFGLDKQKNPYAHELEFLMPRIAKLEVLNREGKVWELRVVNE